MTEFVPAEVTVFTDNDRVRVTRYRFAPMGETGWHTHGWAYVVTPTIGGDLTIIDADGNRTTHPVVAGEAYFREAGVSHNVVNLTDQIIEFVETELK